VRLISNILALLIILGTVVAAAVVVSNILITQISRGTEQPTHLQVIEKSVTRLSNTYKVTVSFYNPTDREFTVSLSTLYIYYSGFTNSLTLSIVEAEPIRLSPGETGKMEIIGQASQSVSSGVVTLTVYVSDSGSGGAYWDTIFIPLRP
jgi:predicted PurR-regulated permease PerM